jgi:hypothetical protein
MSRIIDNLVAYRVLSILVTPFKNTQAFKLGIIDEKGNNLIPSKELKTANELAAYTYLHRFAFNLKKIIGKAPGGSSMLASMVAGLALLKENVEGEDFESELKKILDEIEAEKFFPPEELGFVKEFLEFQEDIANSTGPLVSTDEPVIKSKKKKFVGIKVGESTLDRMKNRNRRLAAWKAIDEESEISKILEEASVLVFFSDEEFLTIDAGEIKNG